MCVPVTFDINLAVMENILHDHHESGVIKYARTSTILGIYKYGSCITNKLWPGGDAVDMGDKVFFSLRELLRYCATRSVLFLLMRSASSFKMHTLPFSLRQDCTFSWGAFVMETQGSKHDWKGMRVTHASGAGAPTVVLPMRRELSWKKQDPPYRLMDVLARALSDQLSCWLHQRVQREWQINYRNEANLLFLS